jgi:predicted N-acetyltransferase YhbS
MAGLADAEKITTLINSAFRRAEGFFVEEDRVDCESVRNFLNKGKFLLAESEDIVVGCVYVEPRPVEDASGDNTGAYLGLLAVDPGRQHSGTGSLLMDSAEDYCRARACRVMDILVVNLRKELAGFYQRRGYVETGTSAFPAHVKTKLPCHFIEMSKAL